MVTESDWFCALKASGEPHTSTPHISVNQDPPDIEASADPIEDMKKGT